MAPKPKSLNLQTFAAEAAAENDAATVPIRDRSGEPYTRQDGTAVTMSVLGEYSAPVRKAQDTNTRRLVKQRAADWTPELSTEARVFVACAALTGWTLEDGDHQPIPLTPENVAAVCALAPWILDQIEVAMRTHASFFAKNSGY